MKLTLGRCNAPRSQAAEQSNGAGMVNGLNGVNGANGAFNCRITIGPI